MALELFSYRYYITQRTANMLEQIEYHILPFHHIAGRVQYKFFDMNLN